MSYWDLRQYLEEIGKKYHVIMRTEYHFQIPVADGFHDFWISKEGLKVRFFGDRNVHITRLDKVLRKLQDYVYSKTDRAALESMFSALMKIENRTGIFCDAGYKEGQARLCVIRVTHHGDMDVSVRNTSAETCYEAEYKAVELAKQLYPGDETIFTDSKNLEDGIRVKWIPREDNTHADRFSNLRKKPND